MLAAVSRHVLAEVVPVLDRAVTGRRFGRVGTVLAAIEMQGCHATRARRMQIEVGSIPDEGDVLGLGVRQPERLAKDAGTGLSMPEGGAVEHELEALSDAEPLQVPAGIAGEIEIRDDREAPATLPMVQHGSRPRSQAQRRLVLRVPVLQQPGKSVGALGGAEARVESEHAFEPGVERDLRVRLRIHRASLAIRIQKILPAAYQAERDSLLWQRAEPILAPRRVEVV